MGTDRIWQEHLLPSFVIEYKKATWQHTPVLLAMTTWFMSSQICHVGGGLWFLFDSHALLLTGSYYSSLLVKTTLLCGYGATHVWNWVRILVRLIPGSNPSRAWENHLIHYSSKLRCFVVTEQRTFGIGCAFLFG